MATSLATLRLDRNPAAFNIPADLPGSDRRLAGLVSNTFLRINRAFRTLKVIVDGPDSDPNNLVDVTVITGASFTGGNLVFTTATLRVLKQTNGANINIATTSVNTIVNATISGSDWVFSTKDILVLGTPSTGSDITIAGEDCT